MPEHQTTENAAKERFWDQFIARAHQSGVKENALRWHVRRAEAYLAAFPDKRLKQHTREDVDGYLAQMGRLDEIDDWQFAQIVEAIQNLLETAKSPVAAEMDWAFWQASARTLEANHPTIARCFCRRPWHANGRMPRRSGFGSTCFRAVGSRSTHAAARHAAIMSMRTDYKRR